MITTNKTYTEKEIQLFEKMFEVKIERMAYYHTSLTPNGLMEYKDPYGTDYSSAYVNLKLSTGEAYEIDYADGEDAEIIAVESFNKFLELEQDEEAFKEYLNTETIFTPV